MLQRVGPRDPTVARSLPCLPSISFRECRDRIPDESSSGAAFCWLQAIEQWGAQSAGHRKQRRYRTCEPRHGPAGCTLLLSAPR